ncbi:MAG: hypothetical protein LBV13_01320 [Methanomassiliicoccaceae archaeon]|jgi:phosphoglucosamine mutase|nr:hypothetical protein [Methanomassiliicoccaceae archaeon]
MISFGVSGVAGIAGVDITPEAALNVGRAVGRLHKNVTVSRDAGKSGLMIMNALTAGICSVGCEVTNIGICPLPTSILSVGRGGCGVMVISPQSSGGHMWVRMNNADGSSFSPKQMDGVRDIVTAGAPSVDGVPDPVGLIKKEGPRIDEHITSVISSAGTADCPVIIDCMNDASSLIAPRLLADMGADVKAMNSNIGMPLSGRPTELGRTNSDLIRHVRASPGSIGIAFDGSGSRISVVDESGRLLSGNTLITLIASHLKADSIAVPISTSMAVDEVVKGNVIRTRVGDNHLSEAMKKNGLPLGGEPSGTFIFGNSSFCPDGTHAAAVIAVIASEGSLRQAVDELPSYPVGNADIGIKGDKVDMAKRLDEKIASAGHGSLVTADGWRVGMPDGWYLIRISNFENKVRIVAEARDRVYMNCLMDIAKDIVMSCMR